MVLNEMNEIKFNENEIIKWNEIEYRVIKIFGNLTLLIKMKGQSVHLVRAATEKLNEMIENGTATIELDPFADMAVRKWTKSVEKTGRDLYEIILPFLSNPELYSERGIEELCNDAADGDIKWARKLKLMIATYWRRGQHPKALMPMLKGNPGRAASGRKRGRRAGEGEKEGAALTPQILELMNEACIEMLERHGEFVNTKELKVKEFYSLMTDKINLLNSEMNDESQFIEIPSFWQFYYFYRTRYGTRSQYAKKNESE